MINVLIALTFFVLLDLCAIALIVGGAGERKKPTQEKKDVD